MARRYFPHRTPNAITHKVRAMGWGMYTLRDTAPMPLVRPMAQYTPPDGPTLAEKIRGRGVALFQRDS